MLLGELFPEISWFHVSLFNFIVHEPEQLDCVGEHDYEDMFVKNGPFGMLNG